MNIETTLENIGLKRVQFGEYIIFISDILILKIYNNILTIIFDRVIFETIKLDEIHYIDILKKLQTFFDTPYLHSIIQKTNRDIKINKICQ